MNSRNAGLVVEGLERRPQPPFMFENQTSTFSSVLHASGLWRRGIQQLESQRFVKTFCEGFIELASQKMLYIYTYMLSELSSRSSTSKQGPTAVFSFGSKDVGKCQNSALTRQVVLLRSCTRLQEWVAIRPVKLCIKAIRALKRPLPPTTFPAAKLVTLAAKPSFLVCGRSAQ